MAVYTLLSQADIAAFLAQYEVGVLVSAQGIAQGIDNTNYKVTVSRHRQTAHYILTLFERRLKHEELPYFLDLADWLATRGIPCPKPVRLKCGSVIQAAKGRPAALFPFIDGRNDLIPATAHAAAAGRMLARMQLAAEGFPGLRRNPLSVEGWRELFRGLRFRLDEIAPGLEREVADDLDFLEKNWPLGLPAGPVHADFFPDNVFFTHGPDGWPRISGVIDFYFACNDLWAYDLAIALNAWCFDTGNAFLPGHAHAMLAAYDRLRPLSLAERAALPVLARGAAMRFFLTRAYDWLNRSPGALVVPKNPMDYVARLRFFRDMKGWAG